MAKRVEIRLAGSGGQGLILAGVILAEAATIYDEKNAVQSQSYGPEARGGASRAEVIISEEDIDYPKATAIDVLLCLTQEACDRYGSDLKPGALLIADAEEVGEIALDEVRAVSLPILRTASQEVGKPLVANIVAVAALVQLTRVVTKDALRNAVLGRVPKGTEEINLKALEAGFELGRSAQKNGNGGE